MGKQPTTGQKKTKDAISKAASSKGNQGRKKWTKGRAKDKINNAVYLDQQAYNSIATQLPKIGNLVTVSVLSDKFKINGSIARKVIRHFAEKGTLVPVGQQRPSQFIYTVSESAQAAIKVAAATTAETAKQVGKKGKK